MNLEWVRLLMVLSLARSRRWAAVDLHVSLQYRAARRRRSADNSRPHTAQTAGVSLLVPRRSAWSRLHRSLQ